MGTRKYRKGQLCFFGLSLVLQFWSPLFHFSANLVHSESERWEGGGGRQKREKLESWPSNGSLRAWGVHRGQLVPRGAHVCLLSVLPRTHLLLLSLAFFPVLRKDGVFRARLSFLIPVWRFPHGASYTSPSDKTQTAQATDPRRCL